MENSIYFSNKRFQNQHGFRQWLYRHASACLMMRRKWQWYSYAVIITVTITVTTAIPITTPTEVTIPSTAYTADVAAAAADNTAFLAAEQSSQLCQKRPWYYIINYMHSFVVFCCVAFTWIVKADLCNVHTHIFQGCYTDPGAIAMRPVKSPWRYRDEIALRWRHNERDSVSNHQPHGCLLNGLLRRRSKKTSKLRVTGLRVVNSPGPVIPPHKGPVTRKMFPFDDVIMDQL